MVTDEQVEETQELKASEQTDKVATVPQGKKQPRRTQDGPYTYVSDEDSDDELRPDVDDLTPRKRRRVEDPTYRPSQAEAGSDEDTSVKGSTPNSGKKSGGATSTTAQKSKSPATADNTTTSRKSKSKATPKKSTLTSKASGEEGSGNKRVTRSVSRATPEKSAQS